MNEIAKFIVENPSLACLAFLLCIILCSYASFLYYQSCFHGAVNQICADIEESFTPTHFALYSPDTGTVYSLILIPKEVKVSAFYWDYCKQWQKDAIENSGRTDLVIAKVYMYNAIEDGEGVLRETTVFEV